MLQGRKADGRKWALGVISAGGVKFWVIDLNSHSFGACEAMVLLTSRSGVSAFLALSKINGVM